MTTLRFSVFGSAAKFVASPASVRIIRGPRGEGKTTSVYLDLLKQTEQLPPEVLPLRVIWVRDTWRNLERTIMENLRELERQGLPVEWKGGDNATEALIFSKVQVFFVGMDSVSDTNKFQGFKAGVLVISEPAPAGEDVSASGVPPEVFGIGMTSLRQQGVRPRAIIEMNPPDEGHWTLQLGPRLKALKRQFPQLPVDLEVFEIQPGENPHITDEQRMTWRAGLEMAGRGDLVSRLILGKVGFVRLGEAVTPEYSDELHLAPAPLEFQPGVPIVRLWDFGHTPTCVWTQISSVGRWNILGARVGENVGIEEFIPAVVIPWENEFLGDRAEWRFRDIGDPAGAIPEGTNTKSEITAVRIMAEHLGPDFFFEAGPQASDARLQAIKSVLSGPTIRGRGRMQISPDEAQPVRKALHGGCHYPKDANGRPIYNWQAMKRASGIHSHPFDAVCYGAAVLFDLPFLRPPKRPPPKRELLGGRKHAWMVA